MENQESIYEEKQGNLLTGILGALLGALIGTALWVLVGVWGYVASIVAWLTAFLAGKGYDLLLCTEDVDDFVMQALGEIDGKKFKSATAEDALPQTEEEKKAAEEKAEEGKPVLEAVKAALGDQVKEVRLSKILKSGACCLSADGPVSLEMERYMRKLEGGEHMKAERVLELNADSAPYAALKKAVDAGDQDTVEKLPISPTTLPPYVAAHQTACCWLTCRWKIRRSTPSWCAP